MRSAEIDPAVSAREYDDCDPQALCARVQAAGLDEARLARMACLSVDQVRQLMQGGESLFYSAAIKRQAYKRLMVILGAAPPPLATHQDPERPRVGSLPEPEEVALQAMDRIIALDQKAQTLAQEFEPGSPTVTGSRRKGSVWPWLFLAIIVVAGLFLASGWPITS